MNIRTYYLRTAHVFLAGAWASLGAVLLFFLLTVLHIWDVNVFLICSPFLVFSVIQYAGSRIYGQRAAGIPELGTETSSLLESSDLLLAFMPAPTLRILLFSPAGKLAGEIRDRNMHWYKWLIPGSVSLLLPKSYGLYDEGGALLAVYDFKAGLGSSVRISKDGETLGFYQSAAKYSLFKHKGMLLYLDGKEWIPVEAGGFLNSFELKNVDGEKVAAFQKGWMPKEWGKLFKELNTPILSFYPAAGEAEKLAVLAFAAAAFHHHSN